MFNHRYGTVEQLYDIINAEIGDDISKDYILIILNYLNKNGKVYKTYFEDLLFTKKIQPNKSLNNSLYASKNLSSVKLTDTQVYWISKFINILDGINITPKMAFETALTDKSSNKVSIDAFKKKLLKLIPPSKTTAEELNNIADAIDINKDKFITYQEFHSLIEVTKSETNNIPTGKSLNDRNPAINTLINSFVKASKTDLNLLPIKGNTQVLNLLKPNYSIGASTNFNEISNLASINLKESQNLYDNNRYSGLNQSMNNTVKLNTNFEMPEVCIDTFLKELEVFEGGEWSFIDLLEELDLGKSKKIASYILNEMIKDKFCPTINKAKIFAVVREIDEDRDGFIDYKDLVNFLFNYLKHKSTKLALKEITRKIEFEHWVSIEDFFSRKKLNPGSEFTFVNFTKFFIDHFDLTPPITKSIYEEVRKIMNNKPKLIVADMIDILNEYRSDVVKSKKPEKENKSISLLDKKFFEENSKTFVNGLTMAFGTDLKENLDYTLKLPNKLNLAQFRLLFADPLDIDIALAISIFQFLTSFSNKNEKTISKDDLYNYLESYVSSTTPFKIEEIIKNLENLGCPLSYCLENVPYSREGLVTTHDIMKELENFYPNFSRKILYNLIVAIDTKKKGFITFDDLQSFIINKSTKSQVFLIYFIF